MRLLSHVSLYCGRLFIRAHFSHAEAQMMNDNGLQLPESTRVRLVQFQQRVRVIKIAEGILAGLLGLGYATNGTGRNSPETQIPCVG